MIIPDMLFSLVISGIFCLLFAFIVWRGQSRSGFILFFLTLFLATWAGGIWVRRLGGAMASGEVLPFLAAGLVCALLLGIFAPRRPRIGKDSQLDREQTLDMLENIEEQQELRAATSITFDIFLVIILVLLLAAIVFHYLDLSP
jgi:hypothetical protein